MFKRFHLQRQVFDDPVFGEDGSLSAGGEGWFAVGSQDEVDAICASLTGGGSVWAEGDEIRCSGAAPSACHIFKGGRWVEDKVLAARCHADAQARAWEAIKAKRAAQASGGVFVESAGKWFHTDEASRTQYVFLRTLPVLPDVAWKTMENDFVAMDKALLEELSLAMLAREQADFANAERHRSAMLKADKPLEYDFSGGWQPGFDEAQGAAG